jgi:hypothetical protein
MDEDGLKLVTTSVQDSWDIQNILDDLKSGHANEHIQREAALVLLSLMCDFQARSQADENIGPRVRGAVVEAIRDWAKANGLPNSLNVERCEEITAGVIKAIGKIGRIEAWPGLS